MKTSYKRLNPLKWLKELIYLVCKCFSCFYSPTETRVPFYIELMSIKHKFGYAYSVYTCPLLRSGSWFPVTVSCLLMPIKMPNYKESCKSKSLNDIKRHRKIYRISILNCYMSQQWAGIGFVITVPEKSTCNNANTVLQLDLLLSFERAMPSLYSLRVWEIFLFSSVGAFFPGLNHPLDPLLRNKLTLQEYSLNMKLMTSSNPLQAKMAKVWKTVSKNKGVLHFSYKKLPFKNFSCKF